MMKWLRRLKRKWREGSGRRIFRKLCSAGDEGRRGELSMTLAERAVPPDGMGWSRLYLAILKALAREVTPSRVPDELEGSFNWFYKEFAMAYPGMVPNNLHPRELSAFATEVARRAQASGFCG